MNKSLLFIVLFMVHLLFLIDPSTASSSINLLGVSPQGVWSNASPKINFMFIYFGVEWWLRMCFATDLSYFSGGSSVIKCRDGSKKFDKARINDDFCDCPGDGTDEPGLAVFLRVFVFLCLFVVVCLTRRFLGVFLCRNLSMS